MQQHVLFIFCIQSSVQWLNASFKGRKKRKDAKEVFDTERSKIRGDAADAAANMAGNSNDQLTQGRNAWRSGEKIDYRKEMNKGTEGQDFTIAPDGTKKLSSLTKGTPMKYGRSKTATPFKLNKYKK